MVQWIALSIQSSRVSGLILSLGYCLSRVLGVWPVYIGLGEGNHFLFCNNWCLCRTMFSSFHKELAKMYN